MASLVPRLARTVAPASFHFRLLAMAPPSPQPRHLALESLIAVPARSVERAVREGRVDRASRLRAMCAVVEPTSLRQLGDVGERAVEIAFPKLQLAETRRVDQERAVPQRMELAVARRVPAPTVVSKVPDRHQLAPGERVHERRLADARRADQDDRASLAQVPVECLEPFARDVAHRVHRDADRDRLRLEHHRGVVVHVELRQHDDGVSAAVPGSCEITLQPAHVEVAVEPRDDEHRVDVRDEHVLVRLEPGSLPRHLRPPREHGLDRVALASVDDDDPVADRRHAAEQLLLPQLSAYVREPVVPLGAHGEAAAVLRDDSGGLEPVLCIGCERRLQLVGPAERGQAPTVQSVLLRRRDGRRGRSSAMLRVEPRGHAGGGDAAAHVGHCKPPSLDDEHSAYVRPRTASTFADDSLRRFLPREHAAARAGP